MTFKLSILLPLIAGGVLGQVAPPPQAVPNGPAPVLGEPPQVSYSGSVPTGQASGTTLELIAARCHQRGLRYNLGVLTNRDIVDTVRAERRRTLSTLLPNHFRRAPRRHRNSWIWSRSD